MYFSRLQCLLAVVTLLPVASLADYQPAQNLAPESAVVRLDNSFRDDAWLVYGYDIDAQGNVVDPRIISSSGVEPVERAVLAKVSAMQFSPATRDGQAVRAKADPVIFTWILDLPREMSPSYRDQWQTAWALFREGNYAEASLVADKLGATAGRNALEEVKYRILAASLAGRSGDPSAELRHLQRASAFQLLAKNNRLKNRYIDPDQYLLILERIQAIQLERMMLADAGETLALIRELDADSQVAGRAASVFSDVEGRFSALSDVTVPGELASVYAGGPGVWKTGLSRDKFSLSDVQGAVGAVYLVCEGLDKRLDYPSEIPWNAPSGASGCKIDVVGTIGTQLVLHQYQR